MAGPTATTPDLWLKADTEVYKDSGTTLCADGETIQQWNDQSGNARHATAGTKPVYRATQGPGGVPAVQFAAGSSQYLDNAYTGEPATVFAVYKTTTWNSGHQTILGADTSASIALGSYYFKSGDTTARVSFQRITSADSDGSSIDLGAFARAQRNVWMILAGRINGSTIELYKNEVLISTDTYVPGSLRAITSPTIGCGWYNDARVDFANGHFSELLMYSPTLSSGEFQQVISYLMSRFGLDYGTRNYLFSTFHGTDEELYMLTSVNGAAFKNLACNYVPSGSHTVRDPSIMQMPDGTYWIAHTTGGLGASSSFDIASSPDGQVWTFQKTVDCSAVTGANRTWAPEWVKNRDNTVKLDGSSLPAIAVAISVDAGSNFTFYELHPTAADFLTWSTPDDITGTSLSNSIDMFTEFDGSNYWAYVKQDPSTVSAGNIQLWTSSALTSGWTISSSSEPTNWGTGIEGPSLVNLGSVWRAYFDAPNTALYYIDGDSLNLSTTNWGVRNAVTHPFTDTIVPRHGSVLAPTIIPAVGGITKLLLLGVG